MRKTQPQRRKPKLATIYEDDENILTDLEVEEDDLGKTTDQPSRLPYYLCAGMVVGCFLTLVFIGVISLNPYLLPKHSIPKNPESILSIPINVNGKSSMTMNIIEQVELFSHEINERLDLRPNTITYLTSTISTNPNQSELLWIYSYLKYPRSCVDNNRCKENFNSKLKTSFTVLSNLLTTIDLSSYRDKLIKLDSCRFIENKTRAILVSLVSVTTINPSETEVKRTHCENLDQNVLLSRATDRAIEHDRQISTSKIDKEINTSCSHSVYCSGYNNPHHTQKRTSHFVLTHEFL